MTLEDFLISAGEPTDHHHNCDVCHASLPPFALIEDDLGWICGNCITDRLRAGVEPQAIDWDDVRGARNRLLSASDWTQCGDVSSAIRDSWIPIRATLRDITDTHETAASAYAALIVIEAENFS